MPRGPGKLKYDFAVPGQPEPGQPVDNGVDGGCGRTLTVGVLDPQEHLAAVPARIEPVEKRRTAAADVQKAGGRGRKTGNDGLAHCRACITDAGWVFGTFDIEPAGTSWHRPPAASRTLEI